MPRTAVFVALSMLAGCSVPEPPASPPQVLRLHTGTSAGLFAPLGAAMSREFLRAGAPVQLSAQETAGSVTNVSALQQGTADVALAQADVAYMGYQGRLPEIPSRLSDLRGVAVLYLNPLHFVVGAGSGLRLIGDLRGRRVGFGSPGGGTAQLPRLMLAALGIADKEVNWKLVPFDEAARQVSSGELDAMFISGGYPAGPVQMALTSKATLLPIAGQEAQRVLQSYPFFRATFIPGGTYPGYPNAVPTIGVDTLLICREDLDAESVYELTRTLFEVLPSLADEQPALRSIDLERVAATPIPLHPGAARYYREREIGR